MSDLFKIVTDLPKITTAQMVEVDRLMIEEYGIQLIQMMENAGRCLAILARDRFLNGDSNNKKVAVLAGSGGNGGGAIVCARRLSGWGANVELATTRSVELMTPIPSKQAHILAKMGIEITPLDHLENRFYDLIIDGVIGYSIAGDPRGTSKDLIDWANAAGPPILSLDTPSGLDLTTGSVHNPTVKADATLTLALPKIGLFTHSAKLVIGELYLGDIGVPPTLYKRPSLNIEVGNIFAQGDILRVK